MIGVDFVLQVHPVGLRRDRSGAAGSVHLVCSSFDIEFIYKRKVCFLDCMSSQVFLMKIGWRKDIKI